MDVTVKALRDVAINHYLLYRGETRRIPYGLALQVMARYPDRLEIVAGLPAAEPPVSAPEPEQLPAAPEMEPDAPKVRRGRKGGS